MYKAKIKVTLKKAVLDPQGKAIEAALSTLGFKHVQDVRVGKYIEMRIRDKDEKTVKAKVDEMCKKLLANPVIEDYEFTLGQ